MYKIAKDNTVVKVTKDWTVRIGWSTFTQPAGTTVILETYDDRTHEYLVRFGKRKIDWFHQIGVKDHCELEEEIPEPLAASLFGSFIDYTVCGIQRGWENRVIHTTTQTLTSPEVDRLKEMLFNFFREKINT